MTWWSRHSMEEREPFTEELEFNNLSTSIQNKRMEERTEGENSSKPTLTPLSFSLAKSFLSTPLPINQKPCACEDTAHIQIERL